MSRTEINTFDLVTEVIEHWNDNAVQWMSTEKLTGANLPPEGMYESEVQPWADEVLSDPLACVMELGYKSISEYVRAKNEEEAEPEKTGITVIQITSYENYLKFLEENKINAPQWVKDWAKQMFDERKVN